MRAERKNAANGLKASAYAAVAGRPRRPARVVFLGLAQVAEMIALYSR